MDGGHDEWRQERAAVHKVRSRYKEFTSLFEAAMLTLQSNPGPFNHHKLSKGGQINAIVDIYPRYRVDEFSIALLTRMLCNSPRHQYTSLQSLALNRFPFFSSIKPYRAPIPTMLTPRTPNVFTTPIFRDVIHTSLARASLCRCPDSLFRRSQRRSIGMTIVVAIAGVLFMPWYTMVKT